MYKYVVLLFSLVLFGCSHNNKQDYILFANGVGGSIELAKTNALSNLNNVVFVNIKNNFSLQENLENQKFTQNAQNSIFLYSSGYLKNYDFYNIKSLKKGEYSVDVGLTSQALIDNINYLYTQITPQNYSTMQKYLLTEQRSKINFLLALNGFAKSKDTNVLDDSQVENLLASLEILNRKLDASAILNFNIYPKLQNVKIALNNNIYNAYEDIYLNAGTYTYKIIYDGYVDKLGTIDLKDKDEVVQKVYLQKKLDKKIPIKLAIKNNSSIEAGILNDIMNNLALNNQMEITQTPKYNINIVFNSIEINEISKNFFTIILPVSINIYENNIMKKNMFFNIKYISNRNIDTIPTDFIKAEIQKQADIFFSDLYK